MAQSWRWTQLSITVAFCMCACSYGQQSPKRESPALLVDSPTAIRLFFNPGNYFHPAIVFRSVEQGDSRLDTAPLLSEGRTVYISRPEMQRLVVGLSNLGLDWKQSKQRIAFGDTTKIPPVYAMVITVISSQGTATAGFDPASICQKLEPLDRAFTTPRALWEFQLFRAEDSCKIPGFNGQKYPDHWPWNRQP
jgi:hypothetical protein